MTAPRPSGSDLCVVLGSGLDALDLPEGGGAHFFRRHGPAATPAHLVDHHANVRAICELGCDRVVALASVGSLRADWPAGTLVCPNDLYAPGVNPTFFSDMGGHRVPGFDPAWRDRVVVAWREAGGEIADGGTYAQTQGPRFETPAEVAALAQHADLVGMTVAAEAILAGEAGLRYAPVCVVDNLANGVAGSELTLKELERNREATGARVAELLPEVVAALGPAS